MYTLTSLVDEYMSELKINMECMETLDFIFAKAKLSIEMKAISVPISTERKIRIVSGRHLLLSQENCLPLDFEIGGDINGVIITGPNTGGKTVALKTVGLLSLMAQSGVHVPVRDGSVFSIIYKLANEKGELGVQIKGEKQLINHKRIKLLPPVSELYLENYDFSIIFDSVENRKARHNMDRKYDPRESY